MTTSIAMDEIALASVPTLGPRGRVSYAGHSGFLSERDAMLAAVLIYNFERPVRDIELLDRAFPEGATRPTLRVHLARLRRRLARVGLTIAKVGPDAHVLRPVHEDGHGDASARPFTVVVGA